MRVLNNDLEIKKKIYDTERGEKEMREKELKNIADGIFSDLANRNMTFKEAIKTLQIVDRRIRVAKAKMIEKLEGASLKEALKEADPMRAEAEARAAGRE